MPSSREARIRQRAYEIWQRDGQPEGRDEENWSRAVQEIDDEDQLATRAVNETSAHFGLTGTREGVDRSDPTKAMRAAEAAAKRHGFDLADLLHSPGRIGARRYRKRSDQGD